VRGGQGSTLSPGRSEHLRSFPVSSPCQGEGTGGALKRKKLLLSASEPSIPNGLIGLHCHSHRSGEFCCHFRTRKLRRG
jgi:hypothetical protein